MSERIDLQQQAIDTARAALFSRQAPETDTPQRMQYRMEIILEGCFDEAPDEDLGMAVRDLLTDVVHYCEAHGLDLDAELAGALDMAGQEQGEWMERGLYA